MKWRIYFYQGKLVLEIEVHREKGQDLVKDDILAYPLKRLRI